MNDFTKEELFILLEETEGGIYDDLRKKIQSMIDNYCEHESDGKGYCPGLYDKVCSGDEVTALDLTRVSKCLKCNRYYE